MGKLAQNGVLYEGLALLGNGAILVGLLFGAIVVFIIERKPKIAGNFALAGAVLTFFGLIHGPSVGIGSGLGVTPLVTLAYLLVAGVLYWQGSLKSGDA